MNGFNTSWIKFYYDKEVILWLRNHPGRAETEADIAEIFEHAYAQAANYSSAISSFAKTGIKPFNPDIFTDEHYAGTDVTYRPIIITTIPASIVSAPSADAPGETAEAVSPSSSTIPC